jgi:hypothetical protein
LTARAAQHENDLIGTWAFVASEWKRADGKHANPFGEDARGMLMYDAAGYMSAQIMRAERPPAADFAPTSDAAFASAVPGFLAYFGTYEIDAMRAVVTHRVIASTFPSWVGSQHHRRFAVEGDTLTLSDDLTTSDGVAVAAATVWRRVG